MKNILILGGGGLIGSELINRLIFKNLNIVTVDKKVQIYSNNKNVNSYIIDLTNKKQLPILEKLITKADVIFFKIALLGNPKFSSDFVYAKDFIIVNTLTFLSIINMIKSSNVSKVIIDSSIAAISNINNSRNMKEDISNYGAMNYYGLSKLLLEDIISFYFRDSKKSILVLRYPRVFSINLQNVIHHLVRSIVQENKATIIGNPKRRFDFIHINDVARVNEQIIYKNITKGINFCHLTSGNTVSLMELVSAIKKNIGIIKNIDFIYKNDQLIVTEPVENNLSMKKTMFKFGFTTKINLNDMIIEVYKKFYSKNR